MNRRQIMKLAAALPFLGFLDPEKKPEPTYRGIPIKQVETKCYAQLTIGYRESGQLSLVFPSEKWGNRLAVLLTEPEQSIRFWAGVIFWTWKDYGITHVDCTLGTPAYVWQLNEYLEEWGAPRLCREVPYSIPAFINANAEGTWHKPEELEELEIPWRWTSYKP